MAKLSLWALSVISLSGSLDLNLKAYSKLMRFTLLIRRQL